MDNRFFLLGGRQAGIFLAGFNFRVDRGCDGIIIPARLKRRGRACSLVLLDLFRFAIKLGNRGVRVYTVIIQTLRIVARDTCDARTSLERDDLCSSSVGVDPAVTKAEVKKQFVAVSMRSSRKSP